MSFSRALKHVVLKRQDTVLIVGVARAVLRKLSADLRFSVCQIVTVSQGNRAEVDLGGIRTLRTDHRRDSQAAEHQQGEQNCENTGLMRCFHVISPFMITVSF